MGRVLDTGSAAVHFLTLLTYAYFAMMSTIGVARNETQK